VSTTNAVCIIVLNWNGWRDTLECLESVYRLDYANYWVLVVDNGSEDGSLDRICSWAEGKEEVRLDGIPASLQHHVTPPISKPIPRKILCTEDLSSSDDHMGAAALGEKALVILETGSNLGYAGGNNVGIRHAIASGAEYVWILNNDTVVDRNALSALVDRMGRSADIGLCGATLMRYYDPELVHVTGGAGFDQTNGQQKLLGYGERIGTLPDSASVETSLAYVAGSATLVSRHFIEDVGPMDERYFLYYEELDWAIRGKAKGYSLGYAPHAIVYHKEGSTSGSSARNPIPSPLAEYYLTRNLLLIMRRFYPDNFSHARLLVIAGFARRVLTRKWANARAILMALLYRSTENRPNRTDSHGGPQAVVGKPDVGDKGHTRILYIMHVDWEWIWQRPHEFARQLGKDFDVLVLYPVGRRRGATVRNSRDGLALRPFLQLYRRRENRLIAAANRLEVQWSIRATIRRFRPDAVWVTHPELMEYLPSNLLARLVYDCMDDALAFPQPSVFTERMERDESVLVRRADAILTSSASLGETLRARYGSNVSTHLVRNGCDKGQPVGSASISRGTDGFWHIGYVGTLANVDVEALMTLVREVPEICVDLVGPIVLWTGPTDHPRVHLRGAMKHEQLSDFAAACSCMVAPFPRTQLVLGVDPVKLYEYVNWGRPIVCLLYPEVERFGDFVEFYETPEDLVRVISRMCSEGFERKYTDEQRTAFLTENTWDVRGHQIRHEIRDLLSKAKG
jgi:GT2 family glycosyltransferase